MKKPMSKSKEAICSSEKCHCPAGVDRERLRNEIMPKIVDGQASADEEKYFHEVVETCMNCACHDQCSEQLAIKFLLKNLKKKNTPLDLAQSIIEAAKKI